MLASILRSNQVVIMSVNIVKAFVEMRKFIMNNAHTFKRLINVEYKLFNLLQKEQYFMTVEYMAPTAGLLI